MCRVISYNKGSCIGYARSDCYAKSFKTEKKMFYQSTDSFEID